MESLQHFLLCFIPLFVAIDALGILPVFLSLTDDVPHQARRNLVSQAVLTAFVISVIFIFAGKIIFSVLGITENDFRIAGGVLLLIIAISDITNSGRIRRRQPGTEVGVVPIGIPLIMGPAALTTILMATDTYGWGLSLLSLVLNLGIVWIVFRHSDYLVRLLGDAGAKAMGKVMAIFLAAIAVMMIRVALTNILS